MLANLNMNYLVSGKTPGRMGNAHQNIVPYQTFATRDGHIIVAAGNDQQFQKLCELAGRTYLSADPRFAKNSGRVVNRAILVPILEEFFAERTSTSWLEGLEAAGVPCGPINGLADVWHDPQVKHRKMRVDLSHPVAGTVPGVGSPLHLSETPVSYRSAPPLLGADNIGVLSGILSWNASDIAGLKLEIRPEVPREN